LCADELFELLPMQRAERVEVALLVKQTAAPVSAYESADREKHEWEGEHPCHVRKAPKDGMRGAARQAKRREAVASQGKHCNGQNEPDPPWKRHD
jgi:hypothetical protein